MGIRRNFDKSYSTTGRYSTEETPPIKAERPQPSASDFRPQQLEILPSPNSKRAQNFSAWVLIGAEILEAQQFCWRRDFTSGGDFNVCLTPIVYCQEHGFYIPQRFSAIIFRRSFPQKFSAKVFRSKFPPIFSAYILGIRHNFHETQ